MKINEILVESQLQEGPILNKIGSAIGKGAGTLAKGVGAVAGGIAGLGGAIKKGFQAGKATVGGAGDDEEPATGAPAAGGGAPAAKTAATSAPAAKTTGAAAAPAISGTPASTPATGEAPGAAPAGTAPAAKPAAKAASGAAPAELAPNPKADTAYAQAQKAIAGLQPEQKKEIVTMLQADPKVKAAMTAKPKTKPAASADAGAGAMGAMAGQLAKGGAEEPNTMANAPVSKTNKAKSGNPNQATIDADRDRIMGQPDKVNAAPAADPAAAPADPAAAPADPAAAPADPAAAPKARGGRKAGAGPSMTPDAIRKRASREANAAKQQGTEPKKKTAAPSQAEMDADRERLMGVTSDSVIRTRPMMAEGFSLFRKR